MTSIGTNVHIEKSMVAVLRPMGKLVLYPTDYLHTEIELVKSSYNILALYENTPM